MDQRKPSEPRAVRQLPVCRLVLTAAGTIDLLNQCQRITAALQKAGVVKAARDEKQAAPAN